MLSKLVQNKKNTNITKIHMFVALLKVLTQIFLSELVCFLM